MTRPMPGPPQHRLIAHPRGKDKPQPLSRPTPNHGPPTRRRPPYRLDPNPRRIH